LETSAHVSSQPLRNGLGEVYAVRSKVDENFRELRNELNAIKRQLVKRTLRSKKPKVRFINRHPNLRNKSVRPFQVRIGHVKLISVADFNELLQLVCPASVDHWGVHEHLARKPFFKTCTWILDDEFYQNWKNSAGSFLWIRGSRTTVMFDYH